MSSLLFLGFLAFVWMLWLLATAARRAVEEARCPVPTVGRPGVSMFPAIPCFPLGFWGLGLLLDRVTSGSLLIAGLHAAFAVVLSVSLVRSIIELRGLERRAGQRHI